MLLKNPSLEVEQYNEFVKKQCECLRTINETLGFDLNADFEKLPKERENSYALEPKKIYLTENFIELYNFFVKKPEWVNLAKNISRYANSLGNRIENKYIEFFNGYEINALKLTNNDTLFFFPCYIILLGDQKLHVIPYNEIKVQMSSFEQKSETKDYANFVRNEYVNENGWNKTYYINKVYQLQIKGTHLNLIIKGNIATDLNKSFCEYLNVFKDVYNLDFYKKRYAVSKEKRREYLIEERKAVFNRKTPISHKTITGPVLLDQYSNTEEANINISFVKFIELKNKILGIEYYNSFVKALKKELRIYNQKIGYAEHQDFELLPKLKEIEELTLDEYMHKNFVSLNDYFSSKKEWKNFISGVQKSKSVATKSLVGSSVDKIYKEFFMNYDLNAISLGGDSYLLLFPCYIVYLQKSMVMEVIPYEKLKISIEFEDKKSKTKNPTNGKTIAQEYTHQNLDGSPNRRYKSNPIIYTVRYFSLRFSWGKHKRSVSCKEAELFLELFNDYVKTFKDEMNAYVFKCGFSKDDFDLENIISDYKEKEKKEKEKIKKQAELSEKKRLQEEQAKEEEERQKKLAIIQRQKERNEEMLRKKELERNAMKLFGEDITDDCEDNFDSNSELSTNTQTAVAFSVLSECLITNNVFKVELRQEIDTTEQEYSIVFVDSNKTPISNKRSIKKVPVGEKIVTGITLLSNIDFTTMKKCFMQIEANGEVIAEFPFKMNIAFYSDF